ncbi:MAG: zinc dependent phospholipase C family protein [Deltaproteobacteria bacterium]|nr:zinc dependent phospholipase C family protein [Deltaproteobacteria bacterium]
MAGTLLHITLAQRALDVADVPSRFETELRNHIHDFRLGAVLVDLPYHDRLWLSGVRLFLGLSLQCPVWGTLLHTRSPAGLARALLDRALDGPGRALAVGFLTHIAVDLVFHTEISRLVMTRADGSKSLDSEHKLIEDQIDLHIHYDFLEHPGIGTPYTRRMLNLRPATSWAPNVAAAIAEVHGNAPGTSKLERWQGELALFGVSCSTKRVPWVKTLPKDDPDLQDTSLRLADESVRLAAEYIEIGVAYLNGEVKKDAFISAIPDRSLLDGGPAAPPRRG